MFVSETKKRLKDKKLSYSEQLVVVNREIIPRGVFSEWKPPLWQTQVLPAEPALSGIKQCSGREFSPLYGWRHWQRRFQICFVLLMRCRTETKIPEKRGWDRRAKRDRWKRNRLLGGKSRPLALLFAAQNMINSRVTIGWVGPTVSVLPSCVLVNLELQTKTFNAFMKKKCFRISLSHPQSDMTEEEENSVDYNNNVPENKDVFKILYGQLAYCSNTKFLTNRDRKL